MIGLVVRSTAQKLWRCGLRNREVVIIGICLLAAVQLISLWQQSTAQRQRLLYHQTGQLDRRSLLTRNSSKMNHFNGSCRVDISGNAITDLSYLLSQMEGEEKWGWIANRMKATWPEWVETAKTLKLNQSGRVRIQKRILVVPGVLTATPFGSNASIKSGGPLGDLYQWSDVIAALHVLGHNVTVTRELYVAERGLKYGSYDWSAAAGCPHTGFDMVFADIITMKAFDFKLVQNNRCTFRVLDAYGTEQMYNNINYSILHDYYSYYGRLNLNVRQFYTFYPHTPDNSFIGFAISKPKMLSFEKENIGLLYGKDISYFQGRDDFIRQLMKHMQVHSTLNDTHHRLPTGVLNHGVLTSQEYHALLARSKYFIGVGLPLESTGVIEALAYGCVIMNPKYSGQMLYKLLQEGKPTTRQMTSQVPFLEHRIGAPNVLTVDISDPEAVESALRSVNKTTIKPVMPHEFTMIGFLDRLNAYIENQDFCNESILWPPISHLRIHVGEADQSCVEVCDEHLLVCENAYFPALNDTRTFERVGVECESIITPSPSIYYPALTLSRPVKCLLQQHVEYNSCAGSHEHLRRVCPCRKYSYDSISPWDDAG